MYEWHYTSDGDRDLPPLLLLHGWLGSSADYQRAIALIRDDFYCLAIDLPGHGQTQVRDDRDYEFIATAGGIIQLLDRLNIDRCRIGGYSLGGRLALYLVLEFPERFELAILESTSPGLATTVEQKLRITKDREIIHNYTPRIFPPLSIVGISSQFFRGLEIHRTFPIFDAID
jgi:2-succinyl-6-hydroxy-2,4-cyclohexadiene-1-carboxylate synthase